MTAKINKTEVYTVRLKLSKIPQIYVFKVQEELPKDYEVPLSNKSFPFPKKQPSQTSPL